MNRTPSFSENLLQAFADAFQRVLSQCSSKEWSSSAASSENIPAPIIVTISLAGPITGEFSAAFSSEHALSLAQILTMTEQPAATFGLEEQEALVELLRQVCGLCATSLSDIDNRYSLTVLGTDPPSWSAAEHFTIDLISEDRHINFYLSFSPELKTACPSPTTQNTTARNVVYEAIGSNNLDLLMDVRLGVRLRFGGRRMKLREVLEFHTGSIVELDRQVQEPVDLMIDSKLIARGEVVIVDGNYGLKVTEVLSPKQCLEAIC